MIRGPAFCFRFKGPAWWGILWAVGVGIVEYLAVAPLDDWGSWQPLLFWLLYWAIPYWCVVGCLLVKLADHHVRSGHRRRFLLAFILLCVTAAALIPLVSLALIDLTIYIFPQFERHLDAAGGTAHQWSNWTTFVTYWITIGLYQLWETLFYGGLLVAARIFTMRAERARDLLHVSAMARSRSEAWLDAARLQALQSQLDPTLLLDCMQELELRYRTSPQHAEHLLEALVEFLRHAIAGLRVPVSTLDAELHLARAFSQLQRERGIKGAWRIVAEPAPRTASFKFPSLLMLPLLALGGVLGRPMLRLRIEDGETILFLHGLSHTISPELSQQLRTRLYALYGERFRLESDPSVTRQLTITLWPDPTPTGESYA